MGDSTPRTLEEAIKTISDLRGTVQEQKSQITRQYSTIEKQSRKIHDYEEVLPHERCDQVDKCQKDMKKLAEEKQDWEKKYQRLNSKVRSEPPPDLLEKKEKLEQDIVELTTKKKNLASEVAKLEEKQDKLIAECEKLGPEEQRLLMVENRVNSLRVTVRDTFTARQNERSRLDVQPNHSLERIKYDSDTPKTITDNIFHVLTEIKTELENLQRDFIYKAGDRIVYLSQSYKQILEDALTLDNFSNFTEVFRSLILAHKAYKVRHGKYVNEKGLEWKLELMRGDPLVQPVEISLHPEVVERAKETGTKDKDLWNSDHSLAENLERCLLDYVEFRRIFYNQLLVPAEAGA